MSNNKYSVLFHDNMSQEQIMLIMFTMEEKIPPEEISLLREAADEALEAEEKRFWKKFWKTNPHLGEKTKPAGKVEKTT